MKTISTNYKREKADESLIKHYILLKILIKSVRTKWKTTSAEAWGFIADYSKQQ
ncbi:MAG TPA: hypothetical protein VMV47_05665 [Bacteroidales bacterium]|nr:hypothetical protein [Bacteroidales bacterium]